MGFAIVPMGRTGRIGVETGHKGVCRDILIYNIWENISGLKDLQNV